ncbi:MAG: hypothetical protein ACRBBR_12535 [Cellvibrionaceae bacterium]
MQWFFVDERTLVEDETNFTIRLESGTWRAPQEIIPQQTHISTIDQVRLIRKGLEFAKEALAVQYAC